MTRANVSLLLLVLFVGVSFGLRTWLHLRRTGSTGSRGISGRVGSPEWLGGVLFVVGTLLAVAGPLAHERGALSGLWPLRPAWIDVAALATALVGIALILWAQAAM